MKWEEAREAFFRVHVPGKADYYITRTEECKDVPEHDGHRQYRDIGVPFSGSVPGWKVPRKWHADWPPRLLPFLPDDYVIREYPKQGGCHG